MVYLFKILVFDVLSFFKDLKYFFFGLEKTFNQRQSWILKLKLYLIKFNDRRKYILKKYVYTINHKRIAMNYLYAVMVYALSGGALAIMIRLEMAYPGSPFFKGDSLRYLQVMTAHAVIMVFFVATPLFISFFGNFFIPYQVGSKDVAFPRLNSIAFWIQPCAFILVAKIAFLRQQYWRYYDKTSFYLPLIDKANYRKYMEFKDSSVFQLKSLQRYILNEHTWFWRKRKEIDLQNYSSYSFIPLKLLFWQNIAQYPESFWYAADRVVKTRRKKVYFTKCSNRTLTAAGWTFITPFSSNTKYTGVGAQDILILGVVFLGITSTITFINLLITKRTLSMPGLRNRRVLLPLLSICLLLVLRIMVVVTPVLGGAMIMSALDRHWNTNFFEFSYGGDPILFQHLFWFFGHPEVYIVVIPPFGIISMIIPYNNTRRISSKHHLIWAIYTMAYLGYIVWGHHMYLVGLDHRSRSLYSTFTIMISLPATIKVVTWTMSLSNGALKLDVPLCFAISFLFFFLVGGFTGMWLSHVGLNVSMHDSFYVVAHFHLMMSAVTIIGGFAGIYFYFSVIFGIKYSKVFSYLTVIYYSGGHWMSFIPMFYLGFSGLPRRIHDFPVVFTGWQGMATVGTFVSLLGGFFFFVSLLDAHIERRSATPISLGIPRWQKRVAYYIFKIRYLQFINKKISRLPNANVRLYLVNHYLNEYEVFSK